MATFSTNFTTKIITEFLSGSSSVTQLVYECPADAYAIIAAVYPPQAGFNHHDFRFERLNGDGSFTIVDVLSADVATTFGTSLWPFSDPMDTPTRILRAGERLYFRNAFGANMSSGVEIVEIR